MADDILRQGVQGITDLITIPGLINLDFADVRTIMRDAGSALMGVGSASGENRAAEAAKVAITSPLIEESIKGATGMLLNITGSEDLGLFEVNEAADSVVRPTADNANIIFGTVDRPVDGRRGPGHRDRHRLRGLRDARPPADPGPRPRRAAAASAGSRTASAASCGSPTTTSTSRSSSRTSSPKPLASPDGCQSRLACACVATAALKRTPLYERARRGGREAGPVRRLGDAGAVRGGPRGALAVRTACGDVRRLAHGRGRGRGARGAGASCSALLSNDVAKIEVGGAQYSCLCHEDGGVLDDLFTYRLGDDRYLIVTNAANHETRPRLARPLQPRASTSTCATSPTATRCSPSRGPHARAIVGARRSGSSCRRGCTSRTVRIGRPAGARLRHRLHRRGRGRAADRPRGRAADLGRAARRRRRPLPGSAPATRCGSRSASTCTATT